jgi:hypothetical protein
MTGLAETYLYFSLPSYISSLFHILSLPADENAWSFCVSRRVGISAVLLKRNILPVSPGGVLKEPFLGKKLINRRSLQDSGVRCGS